MPTRAVGATFYFLQGRWIPPSSETLQVMPQIKIQDGVGLLDAEFNGSFVLQCITCQYKREIALGPPTIPFPNCNLCGGRSNCTMRQKSGVVFVNLIDRVNQIVRRTLQSRLRFTATALHGADSLCFQILSPFGHRSSIPNHTADCLPFSSCVHRLQASMIRQNVVMEGRGFIATVKSALCSV